MKSNSCFLKSRKDLNMNHSVLYATYGRKFTIYNESANKIVYTNMYKYYYER